MAGERATVAITVDNDPNDADQNIDALISDPHFSTRAWDVSTSNVVTYSFPDSASDFSYNINGTTWVSALNAAQIALAEKVLADIAAFTDLVFEELGDDPGENDQDGTIRFANVTGHNTAFAYYPWFGESAGDVFFADQDFSDPQIGDWSHMTFYHELGHAFGLTHGDEMTFDRGAQEWSVMNYNSYPGDPNPYYTIPDGHYPSTFMMYDIAALQRLYGANWTTRSGDTTYTVDEVTGEVFIDGVGQGAHTNANVTFATYWDGGGVDTYDFSNFTTDLDIDLRPEEDIDLDVGGNALRSDLDGGFGTTEWADGHLHITALHNGDTRSLIEKAKGGSGNDNFIGNQANNRFEGGAGNDTMAGGLGNDILFGATGDDVMDGQEDNDILNAGSGNDTIIGGAGDDTIRGQGDNDDIDGSAGNDNLFGGSGNDTMQSGTGDDEALGQGGDDNIFGDVGSDTLRGGSGNDTLSGGDDDDILYGNGNDDSLMGGAGNDTLQGAGGRDTLLGGDGDDLLTGGSGGDSLAGGTGNDTMNGGTLQLDRFDFNDGDEQDRINAFEQGLDVIELEAALWTGTGGIATGQGVVDTFGTLNGTGSVLTLDFGGGDILEIQNSAGINAATLGLDITIA